MASGNIKKKIIGHFSIYKNKIYTMYIFNRESNGLLNKHSED